MRRILMKDESRYILNELYVNHYIVWTQKLSEHRLSSITEALKQKEIEKGDVEFNLEQIESVFLTNNEEDIGGASSSSSEESSSESEESDESLDSDDEPSPPPTWLVRNASWEVTWKKFSSHQFNLIVWFASDENLKGNRSKILRILLVQAKNFLILLLFSVTLCSVDRIRGIESRFW